MRTLRVLRAVALMALVVFGVVPLARADTPTPSIGSPAPGSPSIGSPGVGSPSVGDRSGSACTSPASVEVDCRTLVVTPGSGAVGTTVTVTGAGWLGVGRPVLVWIAGPGSSDSPKVFATGFPSRVGDFTVAAAVPSVAAGSYVVAGCQDCTDGVKAEDSCRGGPTHCAAFQVVVVTRTTRPARSLTSSAPRPSASDIAGTRTSSSWPWSQSLAVLLAILVLIVLTALLRARHRTAGAHAVRVRVQRDVDWRPMQPRSDERRAVPAHDIRLVVDLDTTHRPTEEVTR